MSQQATLLDALTPRYYVRGGLDPRCDTDRGLDGRLRSLLANHRVPSSIRVALAVATIRGYVECRPQPPVLAPICHRLMPDGTRLYITEGERDE